MKPSILLLRQEATEYACFHSEIGFTFGWVLIREGELFIRRVRKRKINYSACMLRKAEQIILLHL